MKRTRWLLIGLLVLTSAGCAGRDWVSDLLVLTDVTGTWEGWKRYSYSSFPVILAEFVREERFLAPCAARRRPEDDVLAGPAPDYPTAACCGTASRPIW